MSVDGNPKMQCASAAWFAAMANAAGGVRLGSDRAGVFQFVAGDVRSHLVIDAGRVVSLARGDRGDAEVGLVWTAADAVAIASGALSGTDAMACTTMLVPASGAGYVGPPAPLGLTSRPEVGALPELLGASLRVQFVHPGGPFGEFGRWLEFVEGQLVDERFGVVSDCDVTVELSCRSIALLGLGRLSMLEAFGQGGEISGDLAAMATLAAIIETPEFAALMRPAAEACLALATLGELRDDPGFRSRFARVMADTELP